MIDALIWVSIGLLLLLGVIAGTAGYFYLLTLYYDYKFAKFNYRMGKKENKQ